MAHFYGMVQGNRGVASRCGSKHSGITAMLKSWKTTCDFYLEDRKTGEDELHIDVDKPINIIINGKPLMFKGAYF